jgi:hypothetical protein
MYTIEIDFEVFKAITFRRAAEDVSPNDVLRDVLGLPKKEAGKATLEGEQKARPWTTKGVFFPHGTEFRATFKGQTYSATVRDGALVLNGRKFSSPSAAAVSITSNAVNGWIFWECRLPGKQGWELIKNYRK